MKTINQYICERLKISSKLKIDYKYHPRNKEELQDILKKLLDERGQDADLNDIDTSQITDMTLLFSSFIEPTVEVQNIDISQWDVSNVKRMDGMFYYRDKFNSDLSHWDVSSCESMNTMFYECT